MSPRWHYMNIYVHYSTGFIRCMIRYLYSTVQGPRTGSTESCWHSCELARFCWSHWLYRLASDLSP